ncbi:hypothetical protein JD969_16455 [Planctomycetota bacterium]|nr:hypothetical protein JD969_16455 [Planctomycetota bacterium]
MQENSPNSSPLNDPLFLYQHAVQHPDAEAEFLERIYMHYFDDTRPTTLREDFAGTCAISTSWVNMDQDNRALAVEIDYPTAVWADQNVTELLKDRAEDVIILVDDVINISEPQTDIVASLNFSALIYHKRKELVAYLKHARQSLTDQGIFVMDIFGGIGSTTLGIQERSLQLHIPNHIDPQKVTYQWEQRSYNPDNHKIDCRIHFVLPNGTEMKDAFKYDWRLWSLNDLQEMMLEAGFDYSEIWCDKYDSFSNQSDNHYLPAKNYPDRTDWIVYVVGIKTSD